MQQDREGVVLYGIRVNGADSGKHIQQLDAG